MELEQIFKEPQAIKRLVHDLKNPLSGIMGNAQVLLMDNLNHEQKETVEDILSSSERLHEMVLNLLDIRQTEITTPNPEPLSLKRLLIVEDEKQTQIMVQRALRKLWPQVEVAQASDGIQAITIAEKFLPEIMILDLMLPGQDGFAVLNALSRHPKLRSTLVLGMTAYNTPENINRLIARGAISCLMKPFGIEELKKILSPYLNNSRTEESIEHEESNGDNHQRKNSKLVDVVTFLGLMFSTLQMGNVVEGSSSKMVKNLPIEEQYKKEKLAILKKVAIMPFDSANLYIAGKSFSDTLVEHLTKKIPALSVIERPDIEKVLSEQKFVLTGAVKQEKARKPGGIEPVDALITGTVRTMEYFGDDGGSIVVNVKIVDVENGKILWSHSQEARCYSIGIDRKALGEELMRRAAKKIAKKMKSDLFSKKRNHSNTIG